MNSAPSQFITMHVDVLRRYRLDFAHHHGVTAYRNGQPLAENPYGKATNREEWNAWNDGWGLVRDVAEHERARAEFAEQACRDAMEAGLAECQRLRQRLAMAEDQLAERIRMFVGLHETLVDAIDQACNTEETHD
jgi:ribosome modulation factor